MSDQSLIKAFQRTLEEFKFKNPSSFSENFAIARFKKKFQVPSRESEALLKEECWNNWIEFDMNLPSSRGYFYEVFQKNPTFWYNVKERIRKTIRPFTCSDKVEFSTGSTFTPTRGRNSVEAKLASFSWDCTDTNLEYFARVCYRNNALKKAARHQWVYFNKSRGFSIKRSEAYLYRYAKGNPIKGKSIGFRIFELKLRLFLSTVRGSRFVSIPKNNENRRPINIEPFCNVVVQKQIGDHLRNCLRRSLNVDLDTLAMKHYSRISDSDVATIDLKNASDAFSLALCEFLLPEHFYKVLLDVRSPMILGPDKSYHIIKKISAMGNGFTFELMSLILNCVCQELDPEATVFGDDIIISNTRAPELIPLLRDMGLVVNEQKSFISSKFRESCGGNFHDDEGYIRSYDFLYPHTVNDCVVIYNKAQRLSIYPNFARLRDTLYRHIPLALRGGAHGECEIQLDLHSKRATTVNGYDDAADLSNFFCAKSKHQHIEIPARLHKRIKRKLKDLCLPSKYLVFEGYTSKNRLRSQTVDNLSSHLHWAKYLMYLYSGRRTDDVISGSTTWARTRFITVGDRTFRLSSLLKQ